MFMEKCDEWLRGEAVKKFKFLTAREELIALEFAAWLNNQSAQPSVQADETICACSHDVYDNVVNPGHCMACGKPFRR